MSCACQTSSVHYPNTSCTSFRYLDLQITMSAHYHNVSLQLEFPPHNSNTNCIPDNTLIKVIHKHNIRTAYLPLLSWGFQLLFWTFSISPWIFSKSFRWFIKISMCIWLPFNSSFCPASLSHESITFATTSMNSFMPRGRQCILHSTQTHQKYTNTLNIQKSIIYT